MGCKEVRTEPSPGCKDARTKPFPFFSKQWWQGSARLRRKTRGEHGVVLGSAGGHNRVHDVVPKQNINKRISVAKTKKQVADKLMGDNAHCGCITAATIVA